MLTLQSLQWQLYEQIFNKENEHNSQFEKHTMQLPINYKQKKNSNN
jgi:hypothetical protein